MFRMTNIVKNAVEAIEENSKNSDSIPIGHIDAELAGGPHGEILIRVVDDGTVVPTAAGGSVPFAPEVTIPALMTMRTTFGPRLYTRYGFKDAINPSFTFTDFGSKSGEVDPVLRRIWRSNSGAIIVMRDRHCYEQCRRAWPRNHRDHVACHFSPYSITARCWSLR